MMRLMFQISCLTPYARYWFLKNKSKINKKNKIKKSKKKWGSYHQSTLLVLDATSHLTYVYPPKQSPLCLWHFNQQSHVIQSRDSKENIQ
jgi:hypothetical protein